MSEPGGIEQPVEEDGVIIEFINPEDAPADFHKKAEVNPGEHVVVMRDAKHPDGLVLYFTEAEWEAFIGGVKDGEFDDLLEDEPKQLTSPPIEGGSDLVEEDVRDLM